MNRKPLGKAVRVELNRNCLLCSRWITCRDPEKDMYYACSRFTTELSGNLTEILERDAEEEVREQIRASKRVKEVKFNRYNSDINITEEVIEEDTIQELIDQVLNSGSPVPPDLRVNDKDIPKARNVIEWMISPQFIGGEQSPFAKQLQVAGHSLAEWCPECSDEDYFENVPVADSVDDVLDKVVFLEHGKCPKCKATKAELIENDLLLDPFDIIGIVGQRGTKSTTWSMIESYTTSKWLTTPNLPSTYKVLPSSVFTSTYTATTFGQAKGSFWDPLNAIFLESEWFRTYHRLLTDIGRRNGEELYKHSETMLAYRHKNIFCSPASPSQRSLRGKTRIGAVIDEAGWFKTGQKKTGGDFERMNGNEVYTALKRSLSTMRAAYIRRLNSGYYNLPKPMIALISSPSARNDLIMTRYRKSQGSKEVYSFKYCLSGETIIRTKQHGLIRIKDLAEHNGTPTSKKLSGIDILGAKKLEPAVGWHYTGKKTTYELKLERGYSLRATKYHKVRVFDDGNFVWKSLGELKPGDMVATSQHYVSSSKKLHLQLTPEKQIWENKTSLTKEGKLKRVRKQTHNLRKPTYMTPELAWILGALLSEGHVSYQYNTPRIHIANKSKKWIDRLLECYKIVFNYTPKLYFIRNLYHSIQMSKVVGEWFTELGIDDSLSFDKRIPDCVLQADKESQLAFIAAYVEGDGNISSKNGVSICSISNNMVHDFHILFESLGVKSTKYSVRENKVGYNPEHHVKPSHKKGSVQLLDMISDYMTFKNTKIKNGSKIIKSGMPTKWVHNFIKSRRVSRGINGCGAVVNDNGKMVSTYGLTYAPDNYPWDYDRYNAGYFDDILKIVKLASKNEYRRIKKIMSYNYEYSKVISVEHYGKEDTYDLSMSDEAEHAYVANGIVVSNCTWEFNPNLPKSTFKEEFRVSPVEAMRDYGCEPPMAANPWIKDEGLIESSFTKKINGIEVTIKRIRTKSGKLATSGEYKTLKKSPSNYGAILGIDAGWNNNSFAFAICYPTSIPDSDDEDEEDVLVGMQVHAVGEIIPRKDYPISFTRVYREVLQPLCQEFNVAVVISDRWQNKKLVQDLEDSLGLSYYELQLNLQNFTDYREMLYSGGITHPRMEMKMEDIQNTTLENYPDCFIKKPVSHLCFQMMTVQSTGTAVIKGDEGTTDDILRACVIAHAGLQDEEILDECVSFTSGGYNPPAQTVGVLAVGSSGSRSVTGSVGNVAVGTSRSSGGMGGASGIGTVGRRSR